MSRVEPPLARMQHLTQKLQVSPRTIRFYESRGLIAPARDHLNRRVFDEAVQHRLGLIRNLRDAGLPIPQIVELLAIEGDADRESRAAELLEQRRAQVIDQLRAVENAIPALSTHVKPFGRLP